MAPDSKSAALWSAGLPGRLEGFLQHHEVKIVAERLAEAVVAVGEGLGLASWRVASSLVPGDKAVPHLNDGHAYPKRATFLREGFCSGEEGATELPVLQVGADAEKSEMPCAVLAGIQPDCTEEWSVGGVAPGEQMCFGLGGEVLS